MARHRGGVDRGLQIQRRDRHAEIDAGAAFDGAVHDLSAEPAQGGSALVLPPDQGAHLVAFGEQHSGEVAADGADGAGRSGHEDRAVVCGFHHHIAGLKLRKVLAASGVSSDRSRGLGGSHNARVFCFKLRGAPFQSAGSGLRSSPSASAASAAMADEEGVRGCLRLSAASGATRSGKQRVTDLLGFKLVGPGYLSASSSAFDNSLCQLFQEERHSIGSVDDFVQQLA